MKDKTNPDYYKTAKGLEQPIDVIEAFNLGFHLGNAIKYILRAGKKDSETLSLDIDKAIWYLERFKQNNNESTIKDNNS